MSDFNRGIMKFDNADSPVVIVLSAVFILGTISALLWWGYTSAYL